MKVRMKVSIASADFGYYPGQELDLPDDLALKWCACGHAEPIPGTYEKANLSVPNTRKKRGGKDGTKTNPTAE